MTEVTLVGKLQDSHWFAGKYLTTSFSGNNLYQCRHCHLKFKYPLLDAASYQQLYDNASISNWSADTIRPDWDLIIGHILAHLRQGGRVLDFGCYTGGLLARLGSAYERYGLEINRAAADVASKELCRRIWTSIDDIPGGLRFDVVIAADVVEHVPDPIGLIDELTKLLDNDGILIITTGDADNYLWNRFGANWWYCFYPEHIVFLSKAWLGYLFRRTGLTITHCESFRYCRKSAINRIVDTVLTYGYGWFPVAYVRLGRLLKKILARPEMTSVPGCGISADHLFIVLTRGLKHEG
jgi:2-polyprenyl-3-methyl-5-hydroxy-6-metoxy-1,4-benzoquinol methylase